LKLKRESVPSLISSASGLEFVVGSLLPLVEAVSTCNVSPANESNLSLPLFKSCSLVGKFKLDSILSVVVVVDSC